MNKTLIQGITIIRPKTEKINGVQQLHTDNSHAYGIPKLEKPSDRLANNTSLTPTP
jgi:hypothetical protein